MFLSNYRNIHVSGSLGEQETLWEQKPTSECFHSVFEFSLLAPSLGQQLVLALCFYRNFNFKPISAHIYIGLFSNSHIRFISVSERG